MNQLFNTKPLPVMLKKIAVFFVYFAVSLTMLVASDLEVLTIPDGAIKLDGKLAEQVWRKAPKGGSFRRFSNYGKKTKPQDTSFSILADNDAIYLGIKCTEPDMSKIKANVKVTDNPNLAWNDDVLELFFCPTGSDDIYYQFVVAAGGALWSQYYGEKGSIKPDPFRPYWQSAIFKGTDFWSVEVRIPLAAFYMTDSKQFKHEWLFNIGRQRRVAHGGISTWSKLKQAYNESHLFNKITNLPLKPAHLDIYIKSVTPVVAVKNMNGYSGIVDIIIESTHQSKGKYQLKVKVDGKDYVKNIELDGKSKTIAVTGIEYKRLGKFWLPVELSRPDGILVMGRYYPVLINYAPIVWKMKKPEYKKSFFPGQNASQVTGDIKLNIPAAQLAAATALVSIKPDKLPARTIRVKPLNGVVHYAFDLKSSQYTNAEIKLTVKADGKVLFAKTEKIRNLPRKKGMDSVYVENGQLVVNGKPRFMLSFFGFTWIVGRSYLEKYPTPNDKCPYVDKKSLRMVNLQIHRLVPGIEKDGHLDKKPKLELFEKLRQKIEKNKNRTDFWFYYLADEPECRHLSAEYLRHCYEFITKLDPYHPVYIISRTPGRYINCADVLSAHFYTGPIEQDGVRQLYSPIPKFRRGVASFNRAERSNVSLQSCPQLFTYAFLNKYAERPNFDESRASVWSAICNNAKGINGYLYNGYTANIDLEYVYDFMYGSIRHLEDYLLSITTLPVKASNKGEAVDVMLKKMNDNYLLIVVNVMDRKTKAVVSSEKLKALKSLYRYREAGNIAIRDGKFTIDMEPYQVLLLTGKKIDKGLKSLGKVRSEMAAEKQAVANRHNILSGYRRKAETSTSPMKWSRHKSIATTEALFDGNRFFPALFAKPLDYRKDGYFEISFTKDVPKFSKLTLHHANINNLKVKILKYGKWLEPKIKHREELKYQTNLDFGKTLSTVKLRLEFDPLKYSSGNYYEIYELELFK